MHIYAHIINGFQQSSDSNWKEVDPNDSTFARHSKSMVVAKQMVTLETHEHKIIIYDL